MRYTPLVANGLEIIPFTATSDESSLDASITVRHGVHQSFQSNLSVSAAHPEEGTSVDDDMHSGSDENPDGAKGAYNHNVHISINRRIQMPPAFHFPEDQAPPSDLMGATGHGQQQQDFSKVNE